MPFELNETRATAAAQPDVGPDLSAPAEPAGRHRARRHGRPDGRPGPAAAPGLAAAADRAARRWTHLLPPLGVTAERGLAPVGWPGNGQLSVPVGVVDKPFEQRRDLLWVPLAGAAGNVVVVGGPQSGKSTLLRSLVCATGADPHPGEVQFYLLDFGGGALRCPCRPAARGWGRRTAGPGGGAAARSPSWSPCSTTGSDLFGQHRHRLDGDLPGPQSPRSPSRSARSATSSWSSTAGACCARSTRSSRSRSPPWPPAGWGSAST